MIQFQIEIEKLSSKNQLIPRIRKEFESAPGIYEKMTRAGIDTDFGMDFLVQMVLHKRAPLQVLVGILRPYFNGNCQETANEILKCVQNDFAHWDPMNHKVILAYDISADVQEDIDRYQYPMPMVVEPLPINTNMDTGYYTQKASVILKKNHHNLDVCLDHLNRSNRIKFKIDGDTAITIKNKWRHLDKPKPHEEYSEFRKRVKAFNKYNRTAHEVLNHLGIATGGEFYLTHRYDKRGRTYCQGYHCTYQGATWNKAVINLANEEIVK